MIQLKLLSSKQAAGVRTVRFFDGRLLTADDFQTEQAANQEQHRRLGAVMGPGIVSGFEVAVESAHGNPAIITIAPGQALDRTGTLVASPEQVRLALAAAGGPSPGAFAAVTPREPHPGPELYLVVASAGCYTTQAAPRSGPLDNGRLTGSEPSFDVAYANIELLQLRLPIDLTVDSDLTHSRVAGLCFGLPRAFPPRRTSLYERLHAWSGARLSRTQIPLAILLWQSGNIRFVDNWSVRRQVQAAADLPWPISSGPHDAAESAALLHQFQDQVAALVKDAEPGAVDATDHFTWLPPVGYLPTGQGGLDAAAFFGSLSVQRSKVDPAFIRPALHQAWLADPIDLTGVVSLELLLSGDGSTAVFYRAQPNEVPLTAALRVNVGFHPALSPATEPRVWAIDQSGKSYPATRTAAAFHVGSLAPGQFVIHAFASGYAVASQTCQLLAGQVISVVMTLEPQAVPPQPSMVSPTEGWDKPALGGFLLLDPTQIKAAPAPTPSAEFITAVVPTKTAQWLQEWGVWLAYEHPEWQVDPTNVSVLINVPLAPLAGWAVFGDGGAYVPVALDVVGNAAQAGLFPTPL